MLLLIPSFTDSFCSTQVVGSTSVLLNGRPYLQNAVTGPGSAEINLGDLLTDSMVWKVAQNPSFAAQFGPNVIAATNTGGIRANLPAGTLTRGDVSFRAKLYGVKNLVWQNLQSADKMIWLSSFLRLWVDDTWPSFFGLSIGQDIYERAQWDLGGKLRLESFP